MRIRNTRQRIIDMIKELVGIKSGLTLTDDEFVKFLKATHGEITENVPVLGGTTEWWEGDKNEVIGVRAEQLEANFIHILYCLGAISDQKTADDLFRDFFIENTGLEPQNSILEFMEKFGTANTYLHLSATFSEELPSDIDEDVKEVVEKFKKTSGYKEYLRRNIMDNNFPLEREWDGTIPLADLFKSEDKPSNTIPEQLFDQRYIDYLNAQSEQLKNIQWRQFEFLTAEYFRRSGYIVEVTEARGDGGVDIIAKRDDENAGPDLILIQCKRHGDLNPVVIDTVKAFWTTINEEGATKGLIVTTSRLVKGAKEFCEAHKYRLTPADSDNVKAWLKKLSSHQKESSQ